MRTLQLLLAAMMVCLGSIASADDPENSQPEVVVAGPAVEVKARGPAGEVEYISGEQRVETPLPVGYPRPTAPGAIEIKHYPSVRKAVIAGKGEGYDGMFGQASGQAFWPLFAHIKSRGIAMTAPVEMNMPLDEQSSEWSMSFLYRDTANGPLEDKGSVKVVDQPAVTVWSKGASGELTDEVVEQAVADLTKRVEASDHWKVAGTPRTLAYNGPDVPVAQRWIEIQVPVSKR